MATRSESKRDPRLAATTHFLYRVTARLAQTKKSGRDVRAASRPEVLHVRLVVHGRRPALAPRGESGAQGETRSLP